MATQTKFFIDGGDPKETAAADTLLKKHGLPGVEGQTTVRPLSELLSPTSVVLSLRPQNQSGSSFRGKQVYGH